MSAEIDPCASGYNFFTATETDWLVIILALAAVVYSGAHYFGYEFEYISHSLHFARSPWVRTTSAVLQNLAIDLIRFVLAILSITLLLVLQCKKAISYLWRRHWLEGVLGFPRKYTSVFERISVQYNAVNHSHYANAIRQRFRAARARLNIFLLWGVPVAFVLILLHGPPDDTITPSLREPEVRPYVVPAWVIRARPENRLLDGSNSHYRPADESLVFDKAYIARVQGLKSQDEEAQITKTQGIESQDWKTQVVGSQSSKRGSKEAPCTACQDETPSIDTQSFGDKSVESQRVTTENLESPDETQRAASHSLSVQGVENRGSRACIPGTWHMESQNDMEAQRAEAQGEDAQIVETSRIESPALESQGFESQSMETESTELQSASSQSVNRQNMTSGTMESQNPIEAQDTESEGLEVQSVAEVPSTKITHTRTIWHTETETLISDGIGEEPEVKTQTTTTEPSVTETLGSNGAEYEPATTTMSTERTILYDEAYRYCSVCQQKHCCQFP